MFFLPALNRQIIRDRSLMLSSHSSISSLQFSLKILTCKEQLKGILPFQRYFVDEWHNLVSHGFYREQCLGAAEISRQQPFQPKFSVNLYGETENVAYFRTPHSVYIQALQIHQI